ncbi:Early endosome antigen 1, partial [Trichoplax sp. H2]
FTGDYELTILIFKMFHRFRKKREFEQNPQRVSEPSAPAEATGFICPQCMSSHADAGALEAHYQQEHGHGNNLEAASDVNIPTNESLKSSTHHPIVEPVTRDITNISNDVKTENLISLEDESVNYKYPAHEEINLINAELKDLTFSLKEEKCYSATLQEEVDRLNSEILEKNANIKELITQLNQLQEKHTQEKELTELFKVQARDHISKLTDELATLRIKANAEISADYSVSDSKIKELSNELKAERTLTTQLERKLKESEDEVFTQSLKITSLQESLNKETNENIQAQLDLSEKNSELLKERSQLSDMEARVGLVQSRLEEEMQLSEVLKRENNQNKFDMDACQRQINDLTNERLNYLKEIESLRNQFTYGNALDDFGSKYSSYKANEDNKRLARYTVDTELNIIERVRVFSNTELRTKGTSESIIDKPVMDVNSTSLLKPEIEASDDTADTENLKLNNDNFITSKFPLDFEPKKDDSEDSEIRGKESRKLISSDNAEQQSMFKEYEYRIISLERNLLFSNECYTESVQSFIDIENSLRALREHFKNLIPEKVFNDMDPNIAHNVLQNSEVATEQTKVERIPLEFAAEKAIHTSEDATEKDKLQILKSHITNSKNLVSSLKENISYLESERSEAFANRKTATLIDDLNNEKATLCSQVDHLRSEMEGYTVKITKMMNTVKEQLENREDEITAQKVANDELQQRLSDLNIAYEDKNEYCRKLESDLNTKNSALVMLQQETQIKIRQYQDQIDENSTELRTLQDQKLNLKMEMEELLHSLAKSSDEQEQIKKELVSFKNEITQKDLIIKNLDTKANLEEDYKCSAEELKNQLQSTVLDLEMQLKISDSKERELSELLLNSQTKQNELSKNLLVAETKLKDLTDKCNRLAVENELKTNSLQTAQSQISNLEVKEKSYQNTILGKDKDLQLQHDEMLKIKMEYDEKISMEVEKRRNELLLLEQRLSSTHFELEQKCTELNDMTAALAAVTLEKDSLTNRMETIQENYSSLKSELALITNEYAKKEEKLLKKVQYNDEQHACVERELRSKLQDVTQKCEKLENSYNEELQNRQRFLSKISSLEHDLVICKQSLQDLKELSQLKQDEIDTLKLRMQDVISSERKSNNLMEERNTEIESLRAMFKNSENSLTVLQEKYECALQREELLQRNITECSDEIGNLESRLNSDAAKHQQEIRSLEKSLIAVQQKMANEILQANDKNKELIQHINSMQSNYDDLEADLKSAENDCITKENQCKVLQENFRIISDKYESSQKALTCVEEEYHLLKEDASKNHYQIDLTIKEIGKLEAISDQQSKDRNQAIQEQQLILQTIHTQNIRLKKLIQDADFVNNMKLLIEEKKKELATLSQIQHKLKEQELVNDRRMNNLYIESNVDNKLETIRQRFDEEQHAQKQFELLILDTRIRYEELILLFQEKLVENKSYSEKRIKLIESEYETQIDSANRKLVDLGTVLSKDNKEIEEKERHINGLRGELAVLEATLQNSQDQQRILSERCIANDDEIQLLRKKAGELKEKLDEAESAMVELSRVNQSLQV